MKSPLCLFDSSTSDLKHICTVATTITQNQAGKYLYSIFSLNYTDTVSLSKPNTPWEKNTFKEKTYFRRNAAIYNHINLTKLLDIVGVVEPIWSTVWCGVAFELDEQAKQNGMPCKNMQLMGDKALSLAIARKPTLILCACRLCILQNTLLKEVWVGCTPLVLVMSFHTIEERFCIKSLERLSGNDGKEDTQGNGSRGWAEVLWRQS